MVMRRILMLALTAVMFGGVFSGCFREAVRDTDSLGRSNREKVCVRTTDGFRYWFEGGAYAVGTDSTGTKVLTGKGHRDKGDNTWSEKFDGSIPVTMIEGVSASEPNPWGFFTVGVFTGALLLFLSLGLLLSGIRFG
jgi:hypothetical protein